MLKWWCVCMCLSFNLVATFPFNAQRGFDYRRNTLVRELRKLMVKGGLVTRTLTGNIGEPARKGTGLVGVRGLPTNGNPTLTTGAGGTAGTPQNAVGRGLNRNGGVGTANTGVSGLGVSPATVNDLLFVLKAVLGGIDLPRSGPTARAAINGGNAVPALGRRGGVFKGPTTGVSIPTGQGHGGLMNRKGNTGRPTAGTNVQTGLGGLTGFNIFPGGLIPPGLNNVLLGEQKDRDRPIANGIIPSGSSPLEPRGIPNAGRALPRGRAGGRNTLPGRGISNAAKTIPGGARHALSSFGLRGSTGSQLGVSSIRGGRTGLGHFRDTNRRTIGSGDLNRVGGRVVGTPMSSGRYTALMLKPLIRLRQAQQRRYLFDSLLRGILLGQEQKRRNQHGIYDDYNESRRVDY